MPFVPAMKSYPESATASETKTIAAGFFATMAPTRSAITAIAYRVGRTETFSGIGRAGALIRTTTALPSRSSPAIDSALPSPAMTSGASMETVWSGKTRTSFG